MKVKGLKSKNVAQDVTIDKTVDEAKKELLYLVIMLSLGYWGLFNTFFTFNVVSIFNEIGIDVTQYYIYCYFQNYVMKSET